MYLRIQLLVSKPDEFHGFRRAGGIACAAALAEAFVDVGDHLAEIAGAVADFAMLDGGVGADFLTIEAARAGGFVDLGHDGFALQHIAAEEHERFRGSG